MSKGEIQLDGHIQGDVHCSSLLVGEKAQLLGNAAAEDVVVEGRVTGAIRAFRVTLRTSSSVGGDIFHQSIVIEQGAQFNGSSIRSKDPLVAHPQTAASDYAPSPPRVRGVALSGRRAGRKS